jgi:protein involved in polysaccharide export with SLBB domain
MTVLDQSKSCGRLALIGVGLLLIAGCSSAKPRNWSPKDHSLADESFRLAAGDEISLRFFGAPDLNSTQIVRRDGKVTLDLIGDLKVEGYTPGEVQDALAKHFKSQLQVDEVSVTISSPGPIYVSGAVGSPGAFNTLRPTTALEAIMEAGGFSELESDLKNVLVIRREGAKWISYYVNFKDVLKGETEDPFYLQPYDVVYVPRTPIRKANQFVSQYINQMIPRLGFFSIDDQGDVRFVF